MINLIKEKVKSTIILLRGYGEFSQRIRHRHKVFWSTPEAEIIRNTVMSACDPIEKWKDVEHWQRKLSNKHNAREFAKMHGCSVPNLYWKGRNLDKLDFSRLPPQYVIRPTIGHSCGMVFLMKNSLNLMDKQIYSEEALRGVMKEALKQNSYQEFLIEEFLRTEEGEYKIPKDYKFYMFNGQIARIEIINRLGPSEGYTSYYNEDWEQMENIGVKYLKAAFQSPPACLNDLIRQAKVLSKAYEMFIRIDFYATDRGAVFGEFTPTPGLGKCFTPEADKLFADYWDKACNGML
jgi:hypothetical protein